MTNVFAVQKVQKRSTEVQAADSLRDAILSGAIPLGARLTEISAAQQLGVSRSTIRTALHQLVQEGLVIQTPYTGWSVMDLSSDDAWEVYTLRASLEALAARLVATRVAQGGATGAATLAGVEKAFERLREVCMNGDKPGIAAADMDLHRAIVNLSGHSRLVDQYLRIQHQITIYIRSSDALVTTSDEIIAQHTPLIEAIRVGDAALAMRAAMEHNDSEGAVLVEHLKQSELQLG
ncbi:GntR family transcriptional regulator [Acidovorax sp.]|uniref:GntR family transcriptional regulator n=1 Tax=Acidovorax sp. TaxID=1872122 RepID=UPI0040377FB5